MATVGIRMIERMGRCLAAHRRSRVAQGISAAVTRLYKSQSNLNYDMSSNGEKWILRTLSSFEDLDVLFDVGANHGEWSIAARESFPEASIHCFEIVPRTFEVLSRNLGGMSNVTLNPCGLSDRDGEIEIFYDPKLHFIATAVPGFSEEFHRNQTQVLRLPTVTGDDYSEKQEIDRINFLKIDVEGHEPQVLRGFERMLGSGRIDALQFEYGYVNIGVKFLLRDFYEYLTRFDMQIGKVYPDHVDFRPYRYRDEDFFGPNYVAVRSERTDILSALSGRA